METNLKKFSEGKCPKCGGAAKTIAYGLIANPSDDIIIGGCSVMPGFDPNYKCITCDLEFGHGGRDYQTEFELEFELTNRETGEKKYEERKVSLIELPDSEVIKLAALMIEARHELIYRGFSEDDLDLLALKDGWKSFPLEPKFDVWYYWNTQTRKIDFAAQFFSHGVRHIHGLYKKDQKRVTKKRRPIDFDRQFALDKNPELKAWNLRHPMKISKGKLIPDHELMVLMRADAEVGEMLLYRFCNPVPDGQMWPAWYDVEQEWGALADG